MDPKETFMTEVERLIEEMMDADSDLDWSDAYAQVDCDLAMRRAADRFADMADMARMRAKEGT